MCLKNICDNNNILNNEVFLSIINSFLTRHYTRLDLKNFRKYKLN